MRAWLWGVLLLAAAAAAWHFAVHSTATELAVAAPGNPAAATPTPRPGAAAVSEFAVLHARELSAVLARYAAGAPAAELRRLRSEVDAACRVLTLLDLDGRREADRRRERARGELARRCADLPVPSMYVPAADTRLPTEDPLEPMAAAAALANLRNSRHPEELAEAWLPEFDTYAP